MTTQYIDSLNAFNLLINTTVLLVADEAIYYNTVYVTLFHRNNASILHVCSEITVGLDE